MAVDGGAYAAALKRKLELHCAAVAKSMEAKSQESSLGYINSQVSNTSHNADSRVQPVNRDASKKQSYDDGDLEENTDPAKARKIRRMLLNRESARRSRKRRQEHLNDLKLQVSRLTVENASLVKRLSDMTQKYVDATNDKRSFPNDVEAMRRKVNIAEEAVRRVTGRTLLLSTAPDMPESRMQLSPYISAAASAAGYYLQAPHQDDHIKPGPPNCSNSSDHWEDSRYGGLSATRGPLGESADEDPWRFSAF